MFSPSQLKSVGPSNSLQLAIMLSSSKMKLSPVMANSIASNIPVNTPLDSIASIGKLRNNLPISLLVSNN